MISWFIKEFAHQETTEALISKLAIEEVLNQELLNIPPGSEGLVLSPYWGPGLRRPEAKGAIIGWSDVHTKVHMYRAIIEGIAFALKEGFLSIQQRQKKKITSLHVSGGGSKSSAICQITADIFGLPVTRIQTPEASSLGVAIASFLAAKEFKSPEEAVQSMVHTKDTFYPDPINQARYDYLFHKVYKKIYPRLHSVYRDIIRFNQ
jgi:sugar (pentulose or hexulose) kinase